MKNKIILIVIILVAVFLRLWYLDIIPTGISDDELIYVLNAKAVFLTGKDLTGTWSPFSLTPIPSEFPVAEIPYLIIAPIIGLLPFSLFMARFPYAVISTLLVALLYLITAKLVGKKEALIVSIVAAFNPWSIFFGRTAYEAPMAIFFYLLAFYLLIILKRWKILFVFIPLFIGFYSYIGTKLIFLPYAFLIILYSWYVIHEKKYMRQYAALFIFCIVLFLFFVSSLSSQNTGSRISELSTPGMPIISNTVNQERKLSIRTPLTNIFSNKIVIWGKDSIDKYLRVFSTDYLFLHGEGRSTYSLWYHGYFYYLDLLFLLIGFGFLFTQKRKV